MSARPAAFAVAVASGLLIAVPLTTGAALAGAAAPSRGAAPSPAPVVGAPGLGDRLFPLLGNGGYDVKHYTLSLRYATAKPTQAVTGTVTLTASATESLSRFDLDFSGKSVGKVTVNGKPAAFTRAGQELQITPAKPIERGCAFTVKVTGFTAAPTTPGATDASVAFFITKEGSATAGQPDAMHYFYPSNDHPSDKASFTFHLNVPKGETAVANGDLTGKHSTKTRTIWTYAERQPMATELTQVAVGKLTVVNLKAVNGVKVRDVVPTAKLATYRKLLAVERSQIAWMEKRVGPYPFKEYGTLVVTAPTLGFALETQTLSLFDTTWFTDYPRSLWSPVMLHELSHQWFGDSVAPASWSDVWQNEGHASWYEFTYAASHGYLEEDGYPFQDTTVTALMKDVYADGDQWRSDSGSVAKPLTAANIFDPNSYFGGALVLYALRQKIGATAFEKVERAWVSTFRGHSASTDDFIALATKVSGVPDVAGFLQSWLYGTTTPPMPGHPDWTVNPVVAPSPAPAAAAAVGPAILRRH